MTLLSVQGLSAGYGDIQALWNVDLSVNHGEVTVILGRNGAGKTTLLHTMAGLINQKAGTISLNGADITAMPAHQRSRSGLAFRRTNAYSGDSLLNRTSSSAATPLARTKGYLPWRQLMSDFLYWPQNSMPMPRP